MTNGFRPRVLSFIILRSSFPSRSRGAVWSARHVVNVEIAGSNPVEGAEMARYANRHSGQAQTLVSAGSTPTRATCEMRRMGIGEPKWL